MRGGITEARRSAETQPGTHVCFMERSMARFSLWLRWSSVCDAGEQESIHMMKLHVFGNDCASVGSLNIFAEERYIKLITSEEKRTSCGRRFRASLMSCLEGRLRGG